MAQEALSYLSKMPHFSMLPQAELDTIAESATETHLTEGERYAEQGETEIDSILVVYRGELALYDERLEQEDPIGFIKPGEVFGGITILMNAGISLRTVIVHKACRGFAIPRDIFQDLCIRHKAFYEFFVENFSKHIFDDSLASIIETGQTRHFLSRVDPFSFLPEEEIERVAGELSMVHYPKDTILFVQSRSRVGHLFILHRGSAERYYEEGHQKTVQAMLGEGDLYGGISMLLNDGLSVRTLRVVEPSYFYLLPKHRFLDLCDRYETFKEYFTDIFGKRMLERSYSAMIAKGRQSREEGLHFFSQPVATIYSPDPIFVDAGISIREAADMMCSRNISALFLRTSDEACAGLVTERDLTKKVIAAGHDPDRPVSEIMSFPVQSVHSSALVFEALMSMMQEDIRHLAVTDTEGRLVGMLSSRDLLTAQGRSPLFLLREISESGSVREIMELHRRLPAMLRGLMSSGAMAKNLNRFVTTVSDAILKRLIQFTLDELGPAPARYAFMILGSEGRGEQTLKTDQDNALIIEDLPGGLSREAKEYFTAFGEKVCTLLNDSGYEFCSGGVMAKNPKWNQPLSEWKRYFNEWIHAAGPEDLLQASIFFDFRTGHGEASFVEELRRYLFDSLKGWPGFFRHLSENALHFKPPIGFFRNFVVESKGKHRDAFDIKGAMTQIVDFARLYALKHRIEETNTLERLHQLRIQRVLRQNEYEELEKAYGFLMQLRFARQITAILDEKDKPDNYIKPKKLTRIEQKMLKEIFTRIENYQTKLEFDFIGFA